MSKNLSMKKIDESNNEKQPQKIDFGNKGTWKLLFFLSLFLLVQLFLTDWANKKKTDWNRFKTEMVAQGDVEKIDIVNKEIVEIYLKETALEKEEYGDTPSFFGPHYYLEIGSIEVFEHKLEAAEKEFNLTNSIPISYSKKTDWVSVIFSWILPFVLLFGLWHFISRRAMGGTGVMGRNPFDFGKTKPTVLDKQAGNKYRFDDVAGLEAAKAEVKEVVTFLKEPGNYTRLGAKIPKGIMLVGPPGTGKTLLAKAVAGEAGVPFFSMSGSEFVEMFVGVGASRVRDLFKRAKEKAPSIIFIDEIDAVGRSRGKLNAFQSNDERESTLNQLLTEMDGFGDNPGVIVLAATNRPDVLDKALLRAGRFDRHIYLDLPNVNERIAIFKVHVRLLKLSKNVDLKELALQTPGFSGADIANICNEAALIAARKGKKSIENTDFSAAFDRIVGGLERKGKVISDQERKIIAYHEAGHATASWFLKYAEELIKVTIVPRGKSLGAAWYQTEEHHIYTKDQLKDRLCTALGGRAAEAILLGEISSGAIDDLEKVTKQAYAMVAQYGLSEKMSNISFHDSTGSYDRSFQKIYSEATAKIIDQEVRLLIDEAYERTSNILKEHKAELKELAELLLEQEVVLKPELERIFKVPPFRSTQKVDAEKVNQEEFLV